MSRGWKRKGWLIALVTAGMIIFAGCGGSDSGGDNGGEGSWPAMDSLKAMDPGDITSISYFRATEDGAAEDTVTDEKTIGAIHERLCEVTLLGKTDMGVTDNDLSLKIESGETELDFSFEGDVLVLDGTGRYEVENLDSLRGYIDGLIEAKEEKATSAETEDATAQSSGDFDILKGLEIKKEGSAQYLYGNDFLLTMPNNDKWDMEKNRPDSFSIYLKAARDSGYDGNLVTIQAFDMDDTSYEDNPKYRIAGVGQNVNKRFVAFFPTDVRWDSNDAAQTADYRELGDYLNKIGEGAVNSPFQTRDSDPD